MSQYRQTTTILFADLSGFTGFAEHSDPEEVFELKRELRRVSTRIVERYGGTLNQVVGDQVMALFGLPESDGNETISAIRAAVDLGDYCREHIAGRGLDLKQEELALHSGIATGLVFASFPGEEGGVFDVSGDTVNVASRLCAVAGPSQIIADQTTVDLARREFECQSLGRMKLKGKRNPVAAFEVRGAVADRTHGADAPGAQDLLGRSLQLDHLIELSRTVRTGKTLCAAVEGPAGIGKTRLLQELTGILENDGFRPVTVSADPYRAGTPYYTIHQLRTELSPFATGRETVSALGRLGDAIDAGASPARLSPEALAGEIRDRLTDVLRMASETSPVLLVLEDLHWVDAQSRRLVENVFAALADAPILLVFSYRPNEVGSAPPVGAVIEVPSLSLEDSKILAESLLGRLGPEVTEWIYSRTDGNPFFVSEIARELQSSAASQQIVPRMLRSLDLPETLKATIRSRIRRLPDDVRPVLEAASVIGEVAELKDLANLSRRTPRSLHAALDVLSSAGLMATQNAESAAVVRFQHASIRDAAYEALLLDERSELHRAFAQRLEETSPSEVELLAEHHYRSSNLPKAARYSQLAGDKSLASFALATATEHYSRAISIYSRSVATREEAEQLGALVQRWAEAAVYHPASWHLEVLGRVRDAMTSHGLDKKATLCDYWMGWSLHSMGRHREAYEQFMLALDEATIAAMKPLEAQLYVNLGQNLYHQADHEQAQEFFGKATALREALGDARGSVVVANAKIYSGLIEVERGDFDLAYSLVEEAIGIATVGGLRHLECSLRTVEAFVYLFQGRFEEAIAASQYNRTLAGIVDAPYVRSMGLVAEGYSQVQLGFEGGVVAAERGVQEMSSRGAELSMTLNRALLSEAYRMVGREDDAETMARRSLERSHSNEAMGRVEAQIAVARVDRDRWNEAAAESGLMAALQEARVRGFRRLEAVVQLELADLNCARGRVEQALCQAGAARAVFEEMEMSFHLSRLSDLEARLGPAEAATSKRPG